MQSPGAEDNSNKYLSGEREEPADVAKKAIEHLSEDGFRSTVRRRKLPRALGDVKLDDSRGYSVVLELMQLALKDPYLKTIIIRTIVQRFREDLKILLTLQCPL